MRYWRIGPREFDELRLDLWLEMTRQMNEETEALERLRGEAGT